MKRLLPQCYSGPAFTGFADNVIVLTPDRSKQVQGGEVSQSVISRLQQRHRETGRVTERHRSGRPLATSHADDRFIVNSALRNRMMNATQLQARLKGEMRGTRVSHQTIRTLPDHTTRHRRHRQGAFVLDEEPVGLIAVL
uniref:Transposase Tc1-like domain-containing protein n=1 Tax=Sinocyclocheilus rhinocerous TaxID=307959 RepID=A0A673KE60_9TELE